MCWADSVFRNEQKSGPALNLFTGYAEGVAEGTRNKRKGPKQVVRGIIESANSLSGIVTLTADLERMIGC